jgi:hypothetical protein
MITCRVLLVVHDLHDACLKKEQKKEESICISSESKLRKQDSHRFDDTIPHQSGPASPSFLHLRYENDNIDFLHISWDAMLD